MSPNERWLRAVAAEYGNRADDPYLACADELASQRREIERLERELTMATDAANKGDEARANYGAMKEFNDDLRKRVAAYRGLLEIAACPQCDGSGSYGREGEDGECLQMQCQWCDERTALLSQQEPKP
jgi:hypothetical protein